MRLGKGRSLAYLGTLLAGIGAGSCMTHRMGDAPEAILAPAAPATAAPVYEATNEPIVKAVQKTAPAVVSIDTTGRRSRVEYDGLGDFFLGKGRRVVQEVPTGSGSGVLLEGGYVLTNQHVVGDAVETGGRIKVTLPDGRSFLASAEGADRATDVALLKVQQAPKNLPVAPLGEEDALLPGQTVIAIGNPVGLSASVSAGVVSALGRPLEVADRIYENLIQTDTAINPGNSGGALIDLGGRVVGINTLVRADAQNIGFAIPIRTAMRVANELKRYGKIRRPALGIVPVDLNPRLARYLDLPEGAEGVVIRAVFPQSPAAQAGLQAGDVLLSLAGQPTPDEMTYRRVLNGLKIGQTVEVQILRGEQQSRAQLVLVEAS